MILSPVTAIKANEDSPTGIRRFVSSLESTADSLEELENILSRPLTVLRILPPRFKAVFDADLQSKDITKAIYTIQHAILHTVLPTWLIPLQEAGHQLLIKAFFCPSYDAKVMKQSEAIQFCKIAMSGLSILITQISSPSSKDPGPAAVFAFSISTISDIVSQYPPDEVYESFFLSKHDLPNGLQEWQDCIKNYCSIPGKVANILFADLGFKVPNNLQHSLYFSNMCALTEKILFKVSQSYPAGEDVLLQSLNILVLKLLNLGLFPVVQSSLPSQISFFALTLPMIHQRVSQPNAFITQFDSPSAYSYTWATVVQSLPLTSQQTFLISLLTSLDCRIGFDQSPSAIRKVGKAAKVLRGIIGKLEFKTENIEIWTTLTAIVCGSGRTWDIGIARAIVSWAVESQGSTVNGAVLSKLFDALIFVWTNPEYIRHALLHEHRYMTSFLLITLAALHEPPNHLSQFPPFISSISTYLVHSDETIRRFGMLTAEIVARRCGQKLAFEGWDGKGETFIWAKHMRTWVNDWQLPGYAEDLEPEAEEPLQQKDEPLIEVTQDRSPSPHGAADSDDESLSGYSSSSYSSRAPSPSPSELAEIEKDPSLRVGRFKSIAKPVYLAQLISMLRIDKDDKDTVEHIEMALSNAEPLIRRKKGFGFELEENAAELTMALTRLRNNYELNDYDEKRQGALIALVECCPRQSAQTLVEQLFTNQYSTSDRIAMLTALAIGARTLADLPVPPSVPLTLQFPSKMLPPTLHRRYATPDEKNTSEGRVQKLLNGITTGLLDQSKEDAEAALAHHSDVVRQKRLRLGSSRAGIEDLHRENRSWNIKPQTALKSNPDAFTGIAAEYFIMPLINHMWSHLRDANTRLTLYGGVGTAVVFDTVVLTHFLDTLAVLVHAARHSSTFLAIIAPAALEMAMVLGSRRITLSEDNGVADRNEKPLATILTAGLEVALIILDGSNGLDQGKTLALEHGVLLKGIGAWSEEVLGAVEVGKKMPGGGGEIEGKLGATAAGVVMNVHKIEGRWGRSMRVEY